MLPLVVVTSRSGERGHTLYEPQGWKELGMSLKPEDLGAAPRLLYNQTVSGMQIHLSLRSRSTEHLDFEMKVKEEGQSHSQITKSYIATGELNHKSHGRLARISESQR